MSTMSQLGEFLATIQNQQDARTATLEERLAQLESKGECGCAETIAALEERLATLEAQGECGCAETITALEERLATLEAQGECGCAETITALEERLATLEAQGECECGSYDELLASYEERISALEGNTGGSTEGEGGDSGSTEPIPASQALEEYDHLISSRDGGGGTTTIVIISLQDHKIAVNSNVVDFISPARSSVQSVLGGSIGDIAKVYTPDLQEIEISIDLTAVYYMTSGSTYPIAIGNKTTKEVYCYQYDCENMVVSPCTDEAFIAQYGNSDALGL